MVFESYSLGRGRVASSFLFASARGLVVVPLHKRAFVHLTCVSGVTDLPCSAMAVHDLLAALADELGVCLLSCFFFFNFCLGFDPSLFFEDAVFNNLLLGPGSSVANSFSKVLSLATV